MRTPARLAMALAGLLALAVAAQYPQHRLFMQPNLQRFVASVASAYQGAWFEFAPTADGGSLGLDTAVRLCDALLPGEDAGAWWCLNGDATTATGSTAMEAVGSPTDGTAIVVPNGASGGSLAARRLGASDAYRQVAATSSTSAFTACWVGVPDAVTSGALIVDGINSLAANHSFDLSYDGFGNGTPQLLVSDGATAVTATQATTLVAGALEVVCGTWSGANGAIVYHNGVAGTPTAKATRQAYSSKMTVGGRNGAATAKAHRMFGAFYVETELSAARIAAISHAVLADQPRGITGDGDAGVALTFTRATVKTCPADTTGAAVSILPSGRPCITQGGLHVEGAATNLCLRCEELDNAAWTCTATACTANQAIAPNGTLTADLLNDTNAALHAGATQTITTSSLTRHAFGCYVLAGTSTDVEISWTGVGNSAGDDGVVCSGLSTTTWRRCEKTSTSAYGAGLTAVTVKALVGADAAATGTVYVWGCQHEVGKASATYPLTSYVPTTSAAATRNPDQASFTLGADAPAGNLYSMAITKAGTSDLISTSGSAYFMASPVSVTDPSGKGVLAYMPSNLMKCYGANDAAGVFQTGTAAGAGPGRMACWADGALHGKYLTTVLTDSAAQTGTWSPMRYVDIGSASLAVVNAGVYSDLCVSPDPTRCR